MQRRNFSVQFKQQIVRECSETGNVSLVARKHELNANMVHRWIKQVSQSGGKLSGKSKGVATHVTVDELRELNAERDELASENDKMKKALGEQALEIAILRDLIKKSSPHSRIK
jgi:transposase